MQLGVRQCQWAAPSPAKSPRVFWPDPGFSAKPLCLVQTSTADALCQRSPSTCFLFVNRRRDTLLMYFLGFDGDETIMKKLDKGAFLLPAPDAKGAPFVILRPSMLPRLFRT